MKKSVKKAPRKRTQLEPTIHAPSVNELLVGVQTATETLTAANKAAAVAAHEATVAMTRLNEAQKAFDEQVEKMKSTAPRRSDWRSRQ